MIRFVFCICFLIATLATPVFAQLSGDYPAEIEARARDIGHQLRCVVCQNQSIEESDAELAADMRNVVRQSLAAGDSEAEIIEAMRDRYGDYVLLKPPVQGNTLILWVGPLILILGCALWWGLSTRRSTALPNVDDLSEAQKSQLKALREEANRL